MFATLLGGLPRPPAPADDGAAELVRLAVDAQVDAGLEPVTDGGLWGDGDAVERWRATTKLTDRAVKAVIVGPFSSVEPGADYDGRLNAAADATNGVLRSLAAAGCPLVEVHEPALIGVGADEEARARFAATQRRALDGVEGIHRSLAVVGGNADDAGIATVLAAPYASLALDLVAGPDNWRLAAAAAGSIGVVCGGLGAGERADESVEVLLWALGYGASTGGRGPDRVGIATAGSLTGISWDVAVRRMGVLGEAVRLSAATADERTATLDPRAISIRSAALGRSGVRRARRGAGPSA